MCLAFPAEFACSSHGLKLLFFVSVRGCLGIVVLLSFQHFLRAVKLKLGNSVATWTCLLTMTQFHFLFYATRPLPNTFALALGKFVDFLAVESKFVNEHLEAQVPA